MSETHGCWPKPLARRRLRAARGCMVSISCRYHGLRRIFDSTAASPCETGPRTDVCPTSCSPPTSILCPFRLVKDVSPAIVTAPAARIPRPDRELCLAALRVFFEGEQGGNVNGPWLESTQNLSLASWDTCQECREKAWFHVRVNAETPRNLWSAIAVASSTCSSSEADGGCSSHCEFAVPTKKAPNRHASKSVMTSTTRRIPTVKVAKLTWEQSTTDGLIPVPSRTSDGLVLPTLRSIKEMVFGDMFDHSLSGVAWPTGLQRLTLGLSFNHPLQDVTWPPALSEITFGRSFDQPLDSVAWPTSLIRLEFGHAFNQTCVAASWPVQLRDLTFGHEFDHPIDSVVWPASLERLTFGRKFNQPLDKVERWPPSLRELNLGWHFDQSLDGTVLPRTLEVLSIVGAYNRPLDDVSLPATLRHLVLGGQFNQLLDAVRWPHDLKDLTFGWAFDQPLAGIRWPPRLTQLSLGYRFNQPSADVKWPERLETLELGVFSRQSLEGLRWPSSLKIVIVSRAFDLNGMKLPAGARVRRRGHTYCVVRRGVKKWYNSMVT